MSKLEPKSLATASVARERSLMEHKLIEQLAVLNRYLIIPPYTECSQMGY